MRPTEVSNEQIIEAGQQLLSVGRSVTGFALRKIIKAGDANRLKKVWDDYQLSTSVTASEPVAELPIEVAEEVAQVSKSLAEKITLLAIELNDKAVKASERRVAELVRSTGDQRAQAERELADASETVDDLESQLDEKETEIERLNESLNLSRNLTQTQAVEIAQVKERLVAAEKAAKKETDRATGQIAKLTEEKLVLASQLAELKAEFEDIRAELADKNANINHMVSDIQKMNIEMGDLKEKLIVSSNELADKKALIAHQAADIEKLTADQIEFAKLKEKQSHDLAKMDNLKDQLVAAKAELLEANRISSESREALAKVRGQLEAVNAQNAALLAAIQEKTDVKSESLMK